MEKLIVFLGWDGREKIAYEVCKHSIEKHSGGNVEVVPLYHKELRRQGFFARPWETEALTGNMRDLIDGRPFSTEFSHTRFLVPELMKHKGWALFMDCDMVVRCDIKEVFSHIDDKYAAMCVKHRQNVTTSEKMDGSVQQAYYRKNWSSFILFNCGHPSNRKLTKEVVNTATGGWLHGLSWLSDNEIGDLPDYYNWIDGTSRTSTKPRIVHYTEGGPWFSNCQDVMFGDLWWDYYKSFSEMGTEPTDELLKVDYRNL